MAERHARRSCTIRSFAGCRAARAMCGEWATVCRPRAAQSGRHEEGGCHRCRFVDVSAAIDIDGSFMNRCLDERGDRCDSGRLCAFAIAARWLAASCEHRQLGWSIRARFAEDFHEGREVRPLLSGPWPRRCSSCRRLGGRAMSKREAFFCVATSMLAFSLGGCTGDVSVPEGTPSLEWNPMRRSAIGVDKMDVLFVIDNSGSMADKDAVLKTAIPDLVRSLLNPKCVDPKTNEPSAAQPAGPLDTCPDPSTQRMFPPITDVHIGVLSSSLGGHGSDACLGAGAPSACPSGVNPADDKGHLVTRTSPCGDGGPSYQGKGFLAWDPSGTLAPPGEESLGSDGHSGLTGAIADLVGGVGQNGCAYESQLESWYRFLVDPEPYASIGLSPSGVAMPSGTDLVLLQQRKDFLRSDSLLSIVVISDENDCSIRDIGQAYFAAQQQDPKSPGAAFHLPPARSECAVDPNDPCCLSCGQDQKACPPDPSCTAALPASADDVGLRCWEQKRRFGIDFLYPVQRYVNGLTQPLVSDRAGNLVPNPIFSDLDPSDDLHDVRDTGLVFFTAIVGVPWQDLARDPQNPKLGFKPSEELVYANESGVAAWDMILGDPGKHVAPLDPHMIESSAARVGSGLGAPSKAALGDAPSSWPDPVSGRERTPSLGAPLAVDDVGLQYACVFPLSEPRDCSKGGAPCDCADPNNDSPLCEADPSKMLRIGLISGRTSGAPSTVKMTASAVPLRAGALVAMLSYLTTVALMGAPRDGRQQ
ncbi:Hypothetical protein A7982_11532 [Minicystis rosea]|nr:Hypothetical protein A7982_11532 [Minicystis rosea]